MKHNLEEFMAKKREQQPHYGSIAEFMDAESRSQDTMDTHRLINEAARKLMGAEDDLIRAAHFRAQELGMGVLVRHRGELDFRRDGDSLIVTALTEAGPHPSVPKGQIHYAPKEDFS